MSSRTRARQFVSMISLGLALGACSTQKEPAQVRIREIEATLSAATSDAQKYVPQRLKTVQDELNELRAFYDKEDYTAVLSGSAAVLHDAEGLPAFASAAKLASMKVLNEQWARLAAMLPGELDAVQKRIDLLGRKLSNKPAAAGNDLMAAKAGLADASSLWSKAQAAFAGDNLREAVNTANAVQTKLQSLAATLQVDLGASS